MAMFMPVIEVMPERRQYPSRPSPLHDLNDKDFFNRYRFSKENFRRIVDIFRTELEHPTQHSNALSAELQLCIALRFYATGSFFRSYWRHAQCK